ncbi:formate dehydrogenase accessory sulfurtransferase FdhD [Oxyplasma meridianum]|uniref:Sulfur carrier protein FdhD n=1 Tax=Oxyplasma meridianum TaxID=3073602 RepID=A0AAX4NDY8_9ARCH
MVKMRSNFFNENGIFRPGKVSITKFSEGVFLESEDSITAEEPLEIMICSGKSKKCSRFAVTMRTPGEDEYLAAGLLYTEGIINSLSDFDTQKFRKIESNILEVWLSRISFELNGDRFFPSYSSCGLCGKTSIDQVFIKGARIQHSFNSVTPNLILSLPGKMHSSQKMFTETGGIHGAALFNEDGTMIATSEDVGRHNAVDKVIGKSLLEGNLEKCHILQISGRSGFEIVQKAAIAGIPVVSSVSAPSSLAVETAETFGITLICFVRENRFNIYTHKNRVSRI